MNWTTQSQWNLWKLFTSSVVNFPQNDCKHKQDGGSAQTINYSTIAPELNVVYAVCWPLTNNYFVEATVQFDLVFCLFAWAGNLNDWNISNHICTTLTSYVTLIFIVFVSMISISDRFVLYISFFLNCLSCVLANRIEVFLFPRWHSQNA